MNLRQANILIVDDDKDVLTAVRLLLQPEVKSITTNPNPENLRKLLSDNSFDLLLLDMNFNSSQNTGNEGLYWLRQIKSRHKPLPVIMITAYADIDLAVKCLKEGATDFVVKPWKNENLIQTLKEILQKQDILPKQTAKEHPELPEIIGDSELMQNLFRKLEKIAPTDANILILGENGTGKDLIAQAIGRLSLRRDKPFVKVDVGALTQTLFESELFGHKKGAFTDAREDRIGRIETASGGTLFLDEIGNIPLQQQAKLLTVLQNRQITRLGSNTPIPVDIRLITATNLPFSDLSDERLFRKDLIYRINTVEITVPPLRERGNDTILIAEHFLRIYEKKYLKPALHLSDAAAKKLLSYTYPGNVRELQYAVERAVIMADSHILSGEDIVFSPIEQKKTDNTDSPTTHNLEELERETIEQVIEKHKGNISRAAKELGLTRGALYRRLDKYEM
ncbi:sigma-54-dependent Fis family transcriptional regulator [Bacteroidia bacterium]|nr:sigma-54-dependent Fis family transcriptional regulator [Bacteroidia bacterium]GHV70925.1 sigma-54-dependent Fis family transcriptional regulator [Bacteroidia bacterium]